MEKMMKITSPVDLIGNTPLIQLKKAVPKNCASLYAKLESYNPGGSIRDRHCLGMLDEAIELGLLKEGTTIIMSTTGNTGISLAMLCAAKDYHLVLVVPDDMSMERRRTLLWFGAELDFTHARLGMQECERRAKELSEKYSNGLLLNQFDNKGIQRVHYEKTGPEVWEQMQGKVDAVVVGVGTGATISGLGKFIKEKNSSIQVIAVEPKNSAVLSGGEAGFHRIEGLGAGFIPKNLKREYIDEVFTVTDEEAFLYANKLGRKEGLSVGISSGAAACAAIKTAQKLGEGKSVLTFFPDSWERHTSLEKFFTS